MACFASAALLFALQPFVGRLLVPRFGGVASVWTTCLVFFQSALLVGYAWAHAMPKVFGERRHAVLHVALLVVAGVLLPPGVRAVVSGITRDPTLPLLAALTISLGVPVALLSATAPLVQRWRSSSGHPAPYALYAASNAGSLMALLAYPFVIEPLLGLRAQSIAWTVGYVCVVGLVAICLPWRNRPIDEVGAGTLPALSGERRGGVVVWFSLAFVPASLLLGSTAYITTDLAPLPLLWVFPLAIYLASFIVAFGRIERTADAPLATVAPSPVLVASYACLAVLLFVCTLPRLTPGYMLATMHLVLVALGSLVFHCELARVRPPPASLTRYYLATATGGAFAGVLCSLVAPRVFAGITEYPLAIALSLLLLPRPQGLARPPITLRDIAVPIGVGMIAYGIFRAGLTGGPGRFATYGLPVALCAMASFGRRVPLGLGLIAIIVASRADPTAIARARSFYGVFRVERNHGQTWLLHGTTVHGTQATDPARAGEPTTYYARGGPAGQVFTALDPALAGSDIAVVGMGAGTLTAYARAGQRWTYYELDPTVENFARRYFTWLSHSPAPVSVVLGDARLRLADAHGASYRLIVLDAFNSDAVPVHLLTREAFAVYLARLTPDGQLLVHLSARYVHLDEVIASTARDLGLHGIICHDQPAPHEGRMASMWALLARRPAELEGLAHDLRWRPLSTVPDHRAWTDDRIDLLSVLRRPAW